MKIGIVANGPTELVPDLSNYNKQIDIWIGVDRGTLCLVKQDIMIEHAIGDFDSTTYEQKIMINNHAKSIESYPIEKDKTDLELAIDKALEYNPKQIYLFGVTGGRMDHLLVNIQLLLPLLKQGVRGFVIDLYNELQLFYPGVHMVVKDDKYPNISFLPLTETVYGLTLKGFYYPLKNETVHLGSTLCISNKLLRNNGTFSFRSGILLLIKSRDSQQGPFM
ncbi:thiamine diphosphokinase [Cerasibacillus terrae]|uniref:Thiamine diphosphokinase n=1 Tax=Cerasibacillus terrae TaxID=2498845 RepID=A0A5C8P215_9BACI|nr:thiamine diphosphokinase [Cerasibacillus terrae]TXL67639.1 thiamine diphosphokinase [Cerasibacillus terrae]